MTETVAESTANTPTAPPPISDLINLTEIVAVGIKLSRSWFRGHSRCWGTLAPSAFRGRFETIRSLREDLEFAAVAEFRRVAPAYCQAPPAKHDYLRWLLMMQHFGTPTRLLDWSESILVAAYFAAAADPESDGELWALYPDELNRASIGRFELAIEQSRHVRYLAGRAFHNSPERLRERLKISEPRGPIAFTPPLIFGRLLAQSSVFTVHPRPDRASGITSLLGEPRHLCRYRIPQWYKPEVIRQLEALGVTRRTLFPDLDGLSGSIHQQMATIAYTPPEPPIFTREAAAS